MASPTHQPLMPPTEGCKGTTHSDSNVTEHTHASQGSDQLLEEDPLNSSGNCDDHSKLLSQKSSQESTNQNTSRSNGQSSERLPAGQEREIVMPTTTKNASQPSHVFNRCQSEQRNIQPQNTNHVLERQHSLGNSYITRNSKPLQGSPGDDPNANNTASHQKQQPAILEVKQNIIDDSNAKQQTATNPNASQAERFPLQRQTKMEDHHHHNHPPNIPSPNSPNEHNIAQILPKQVMVNKLKTPLRATQSLGDRTDAKSSKLNKEERWSSLEVPSIKVRSEEDASSPENDGKSPSNGMFTLGDSNKEESMKKLNGNANNSNTTTITAAPSVTTDTPSPTPPANRQSLNLAQRHLLSKTVGRSTGIKLKGTYSLDVPDRLTLHPSHSLNNVPELERTTSNKLTEFQKVEDKLISNSLTRLDNSQRRRSWAPDTSPRGSKGFVFDKDLLG